MNGIQYAFPMLTPKLQLAGFNSAQVVITGVLIQLGYGLISYPFGRFYSSTALNLSPAWMDRVVNAFACFLVLTSIAIMIGVVAPTDLHEDVTVNGGALSFAFFLWGAGLGISSFHSLSLVSYIFATNKSRRRMAVASMAFAIGVGSVGYTLLFHYVFTRLSLTYNFVILIGAYAVLTALRLMYMERGRFDPLSDDDKEAPMLSSPSNASSQSEVQAGSVVLPREESPDPAVTSSPDSSSTPASVTAPTATSLAPKLMDYLKSKVVWLTSISTFFGFGVGSAYLSSLGNLATSLVDGADAIDDVTYNLTLSFLCLVILARLTTTIIYAYLNWPHVMTLWNATLFLGIIVYLSAPTLVGAYCSAALVGLGFGGVSSAPSVIASTNFPGSVAYYSINLSVAVTVMSFGPTLIGSIETVVYEKSSLAGFNDDDFEYLASFIYFLCASFVSTAASVFLGLQIRKDYKLEIASLQTLEAELPQMISETNCEKESARPRSIDI